MTVSPFTYLAPTSVEEACKLLYDQEGEAKALAGGQSLIPLMKLNLVQISSLVDLKRIPGLTFIRMEKGGPPAAGETLCVGALTTHSELAGSELVAQKVPLLGETARGIGHPLVRNRGTIGGSLSHCDPSADLCATSLALDAEMVIARADGSRRRVGAEGFFRGLFSTALERGEILEKVCFPVPQAGTGYDFQKLTLGHGDFPLVVVSVLLRVEEKRCTDVRLALGGVSETVVRMKEAEGILRGSRLAAEDLEKAAEAAEAASKPSSDLEVSEGYKKRMVKVLVRRAVGTAMSRSEAR